MCWRRGGRCQPRCACWERFRHESNAFDKIHVRMRLKTPLTYFRKPLCATASRHKAKPWELTLAVLRGNLLWANSLLRHPSAKIMRHERCSLPLLHAIAAADAAALVPAAVAAGVPITSASVTVRLSKRRLGPAIDFIPQEAAAVLLDRHGICALTLAASLGHAATVAALLAAGADPNPVHPDGQPVLHPLAAAATLQDEMAALATCQVLLAAGADVAGALDTHLPAGGRHARSCSWLLNMQSSRVEQLILGALLERWKNDSWRPSTWGTASALVLLAAQADHRQAFQKFASHLPAGRLPAEYAELAEDAVGAALRAACWGSRGDVLRCLVQLATGGRPQRSSRTSQPHVLSLHLAAEVAASLEAAAADGGLQVLQCLVRAGTVVSQTAVKAAVCSGRPAALALLLQHGAPSAPPLLAGTVPTISDTAVDEEDALSAAAASWRSACPGPLLTLLTHHAHEVGSGLGVWTLPTLMRDPSSGRVCQKSGRGRCFATTAAVAGLRQPPGLPSLAPPTGSALPTPCYLFPHRAWIRCTPTAWRWQRCWWQPAVGRPRAAACRSRWAGTPRRSWLRSSTQGQRMPA